MNRLIRNMVVSVGKHNKNSVLQYIRYSFLVLTPVLLTGACAQTVQHFPISAVRIFIENALNGRLYDVLEAIYQATFGFAAVYLVFVLSFFIAASHMRYLEERICAAVSSTACYFAFLGPEVLSGEHSLLSYTSMANVFPALLIALLFTRLFLFTYGFTRRRVKNHSSAFMRSMMTVRPIAVCVLAAAIAEELINIIPDICNFNDLILRFLSRPFEKLGATYLGGLLVVVMESVLCMFGIHGGNVFDNLLTSETGAFAFSHGQIATKQFLDTYALLGGCGTAVCLLIAAFLFAGNPNKRKICRMAAWPMLFNINEILIFGYPVVLNPVYLVPFILVPAAAYSVAYLATLFGIVPQITNAAVQWTTPVLISGYQATGSILGSILQLVIIAMGVAIYAPFVRLEDRIAAENEDRLLRELTDLFRDYEQRSERFTLEGANPAVSAFAANLTEALTAAVAAGNIPLNYQPQIRSERIVAAEALLRFRYNGKSVYPPLVVALARRENLFDPLTRVIVRRALSDLQSIQRTNPEFKLAVNIPIDLLLDVTFRTWLLDMVGRSDITPYSFGVELTEDAKMSDSDAVSTVFAEMKALGIVVLMDDFSMGHTSITLLQKNYFDYIKIDGSLIRDLKNERSRSIVESVIRLGHELGFAVISECVETKEQHDMLLSMGCFEYQGYLYYRDMPLPELEALLSSVKE